MNNTINEFLTTIQQYGLTPPAYIEPGNFYRFPGLGKPPSNRAAYCKLFHEGNGGIFGDHSSGLRQVWFQKGKSDYRGQKIPKINNETTTKEQHENAAFQAQQIWYNSRPANPFHPYLIKKQVAPYGIRQKGSTLLIPIKDQNEIVTGLQFIYPNGNKRFIKNCKKKGCCNLIGDITPIMYMCEGWATGATIYRASNCGVIVAMDASNLVSVAEWITSQYTNSKIFVCADNDEQGITSALTASKILQNNTKPIIPIFNKNHSEASDFNDLMICEGISTVENQIKLGASNEN